MAGATATPWLAPEARFMLIDPANGSEQADVTAEIKDRLTSVRVELLNTGPSTLDLTLSNLRFGEVRTERDDRVLTQQPVVPPFAYNGFDKFRFGAQVRVDVRYAQGAGYPGLDKDTVALGTPHTFSEFVPLIRARVTNMRFAFGGGSGYTLQVQGEDLLSALASKPPADKNWRDMSELEIVEKIREKVYGTSGILLKKSTDAGITTKLRHKHQDTSATYLDFVQQQLAKHLDYELFVAFDEPANPTSKLSLHFERSRSLAKDKDTLVDLVWGLNIVSFQPTFQVWDQYTSVKGRSRDPNTSDHPSVAAEAKLVKADAPFEDGNFITAPEVRQNLKDNLPPDNPEPLRLTNLDAPRQTRAAEARLLNQSRKFLTAEIETLGLPSLRPGIHVRVGGLNAPFDGYYYVTKARHTLDGGGYKTSLSVRRPGYTNPGLYAGATKSTNGT